jgi:hypothetical protein
MGGCLRMLLIVLIKILKDFCHSLPEVSESGLGKGLWLAWGVVGGPRQGVLARTRPIVFHAV